MRIEKRMLTKMGKYFAININMFCPGECVKDGNTDTERLLKINEKNKFTPKGKLSRHFLRILSGLLPLYHLGALVALWQHCNDRNVYTALIMTSPCLLGRYDSICTLRRTNLLLHQQLFSIMSILLVLPGLLVLHLLIVKLLLN